MAIVHTAMAHLMAGDMRLMVMVPLLLLLPHQHQHQLLLRQLKKQSKNNQVHFAARPVRLAAQDFFNAIFPSQRMARAAQRFSA